jgi:hypothetical protein
MEMSEATLKNMLLLFENIDQYRDLVAERMERAGMTADPAVAESVAKYWPALEKLAAE